MKEKHILLIISGGIAAVKIPDLIRRLIAQGSRVTPVLTQSSAKFVTPLSIAALARSKVYTELFDLTEEAQMGHIELSRAADLILVAPATAQIIAKMAHGMADDLATTLLLATDTPVMIAPSMNVRMWQHPATQRNLKQLQQDEVQLIDPNDGEMACGEYGPGRMAEVDEILAQVAGFFRNGPLEGRHVLVTSGPTHEPIDPVRYIANRSSGAQGAALAEALRDLGARVSFVTGPASVPPPTGVDVHPVQTAQDMLAAVEGLLPVDAAVFAAAVADWRIVGAHDQKIKKRSFGDLPVLQFAENSDILARVSAHDLRPQLVVGFAAETENVIDNATAKRLRKGCDWIVANDVGPETGIMGGTHNKVTVIDAVGAETWDEMPKIGVARQLALRIADALT
ncbi:MAG: bifunctional phosphopantothenoylcysteine decarboxylase/phosphopantothenate--cysteine ligase CoaBC [Planktomarina sp.]|uniref:bifunctional phosphopantothenoylcysteine decarboxylase/phosphopantothenate--cysteine ligase CoaBC n=1 Tax=Planktomarina sp. TaxID=2024851 RepID=UPI0028914E84|nr:bifunctional phosphopantothenoylcysteine decarboxylase/phosphopantothenate--cysteine ligase CoaBC [Planktomarina sp.]MDT2030302.1 bifunctional phosphopantothenoylcysteine decarboxylase/phosphopantothenate--cysteine ligase CoaBC [Planktomarina sp.]MDT2070877.1 bifunctional phosphopantothenoylcysteine decarboxylase/phosphopantothenate--cysteine ligase CoaBC [Planktomarina sp.]